MGVSYIIVQKIDFYITLLKNLKDILLSTMNSPFAFTYTSLLFNGNLFTLHRIYI